MTVAEAARIFVERKPQLAVLRRELDDAEKVLKDHFRRTGRKTWRNRIAYKASTYTALDVALARTALGAKAAGCEVERTRETLTALD